MRHFLLATAMLISVPASAQSFLYSTQWFVGVRENVLQQQDRVRARAEAIEAQRAKKERQTYGGSSASAAPDRPPAPAEVKHSGE